VRVNEHKHEHGGVQGVLILNYDCYEDDKKKEEITYASQLSAGNDNSVILLEYHQDKGIMDNTKEEKDSERYTISADKLVSLIKEHGNKMN
jgi:hypothetical protein